MANKKNNRIRKNIASMAKTKISVLFDSYKNGQERTTDLNKQIDRFDFLENKDIIKTELEKCIAIETRKEFVEQVMIIIKPFIDLKIKKLELLEKFGFIVDGEISEEIRQAHFFGDNSNISRAHISRNDFLEKYLAK